VLPGFWWLCFLRCRSVLRGALAGCTSTLVALAGFYAALTAVLAGQLGGGGHLAELLVEVVPTASTFLAASLPGQSWEQLARGLTTTSPILCGWP
jgi:hypothetical protein